MLVLVFYLLKCLKNNRVVYTLPQRTVIYGVFTIRFRLTSKLSHSD